jgi:hypothetical protein
MTKLLISIWILIIGFIVGLLLGLSTPEQVKNHFAYTIKKEMQIGKDMFWVGEVRYRSTKYKNLYLAEVKKRYPVEIAGIGGEGRVMKSEEK